MARYVHFEHYVEDGQKAVEFYQKAFGWTAEQFGEWPYWLVTTGPGDQPGIDGGISATPAPGGQKVINTIGVDDVDEAVGKAEEAGATVLVGKQAVPGQGWVAYLSDPTGIVFGVFQMDMSAA
jgi:predicted enzyme related to lactoylglutathione lyase